MNVCTLAQRLMEFYQSIAVDLPAKQTHWSWYRPECPRQKGGMWLQIFYFFICFLCFLCIIMRFDACIILLDARIMLFYAFYACIILLDARIMLLDARIMLLDARIMLFTHHHL